MLVDVISTSRTVRTIIRHDYDARIFVQLFNGLLECIDRSIIDCSDGSFPDVCQYLNLHLEGSDINGTLNLYAGK